MSNTETCSLRGAKSSPPQGTWLLVHHPTAVEQCNSRGCTVGSGFTIQTRLKPDSDKRPCGSFHESMFTVSPIVLFFTLCLCRAGILLSHAKKRQYDNRDFVLSILVCHSCIGIVVTQKSEDSLTTVTRVFLVSWV